MNVFISPPDAAATEQPLFVDCRHLLTDPDYGSQKYKEEHIAGAIFAHLDKDLSGPITETTGRHPLPDLNDFHNWLQENGIHPNRVIIIYDNFQGGIAARLWWMLLQLGFNHVKILSSGLEGWKARNLPTSSGDEKYPSVTFDLSIDSWDQGPYRLMHLQDIEQIIPSGNLIDSRAEARFKGLEEPYDRIAGRIPGARNIFWKSHIEESELDHKKMRTKVSEKVDPSKLAQYTVYCGSGVTACFNLAVFEELGMPRPSFYPGSYSEWSRNHPDTIEIDE